MSQDLSGHELETRQPREEARTEYPSASQAHLCLYGRIVSLVCLVLRQPYPIVADFEEATRDIELAPGPCLWDAIVAACETSQCSRVR